jgi:hypothetical protein
MIDQATLLTYLAVLTGFVFIPGPAVLMTLARATSSGTRVGVATGLGIAGGDLVHTAMAVFGLSAVLAASATLFNVVKYLGAAYLVYLGIRAIVERTDSGLLARAAYDGSQGLSPSRSRRNSQSQISAVLPRVSPAIRATPERGGSGTIDRPWPSLCDHGRLQHDDVRDRGGPHRRLPAPECNRPSLARQASRRNLLRPGCAPGAARALARPTRHVRDRLDEAGAELRVAAITAGTRDAASTCHR